MCFKIDKKIKKTHMLGNMTNEKGENLFHILFNHYQTSGLNENQLKELDSLIKLLKERGVDLWHFDN